MSRVGTRVRRRGGAAVAPPTGAVDVGAVQPPHSGGCGGDAGDGGDWRGRAERNRLEALRRKTAAAAAAAAAAASAGAPAAACTGDGAAAASAPAALSDVVDVVSDGDGVVVVAADAAGATAPAADMVGEEEEDIGALAAECVLLRAAACPARPPRARGRVITRAPAPYVQVRTRAGGRDNSRRGARAGRRGARWPL